MVELYLGNKKIDYLDVLVLLIGNNHLYLCTVYSRDNPNLLFSMCGFEVRTLPKIRAIK